MPVERDRILGELAVEQGLIAREDAARFYAFLDGTPNPPPLSQLLVQEGRATAQDLQRLREIWQSRQGSSAAEDPDPERLLPHEGAAASGADRAAAARLGVLAAERAPLAPLPDEAAILAEPTVVIRGDKRRAPAPFQGRQGPPPTQPLAPAAPQPLDAIGLKKDELLARILVARNLLTVDRAREARALQIQHKVRLGPVLARGNYVERGQLEEVIRYIREQVVVCVRCNTPQERGRLAGATTCPRCGGRPRTGVRRGPDAHAADDAPAHAARAAAGRDVRAAGPGPLCRGRRPGQRHRQDGAAAERLRAGPLPPQRPLRERPAGRSGALVAGAAAAPAAAAGLVARRSASRQRAGARGAAALRALPGRARPVRAEPAGPGPERLRRATSRWTSSTRSPRRAAPS